MYQFMQRNNDYYLARLRKEGRHELLEKISCGQITVYEASCVVGYRKKALRPSADKLSHVWLRTGQTERLKFAARHLVELSNLVKEVIARVQAEKNQE